MTSVISFDSFGSNQEWITDCCVTPGSTLAFLWGGSSVGVLVSVFISASASFFASVMFSVAPKLLRDKVWEHYDSYLFVKSFDLKQLNHRPET